MLEYLQSIGLSVWALLLAMIGFFTGLVMLTWVRKTIGLKFAWQLFKMKSKKNKKKILVKVWLPSGKPEYIIADASKRIEYKYKENGETKKAMFFYDHFAKYTEFADIPVIESTPDDIVPRNPFVKSSLNMSPQVIRKNIIDSAKEGMADETFKKWAKMALPLVIAIGVIIILYSSNQNEQLANLTTELAKCYSQMPKSATIVGG